MKIIFERRHPALIAKRDIWKLLQDAYVGGILYNTSENLFRYPRENSYDYDARKKRAVYFNAVQPLADILAGLVFLKNPKRTIPESLKYLEKAASRSMGMDQFMQLVAVHSLLYTVGILVDSPSFDPAVVKSRGDREKLGLNPYCRLYLPWQIRDFNLSQSGDLEWIILDNSFTDSTDPIKEPIERTVYRLWTKEFFQDFELKDKDTVEAGAKMPHTLGKVPFVFQSWRDMNDDKIADSPFEDIALIDRQIYNLLSYLDEMLAAGTFKVLFYPGTAPDSIKKEGLGNLTLIEFDPAATNKPYFDGARLEDIGPFLEALQIYRKAQLEKLGLDKDQEKAGVQSGVAKKLEYRKAQALLNFGAKSLEDTERQIFKFAALWENIQQLDPKSIAIDYCKSFDGDDIDMEIKRLLSIFETVPYDGLRKSVAKQIAKATFPDSTELEGIVESIEAGDGDSDPSILAKKLADQMAALKNTSNPKDEKSGEVADPALKE